MVRVASELQFFFREPLVSGVSKLSDEIFLTSSIDAYEHNLGLTPVEHAYN